MKYELPPLRNAADAHLPRSWLRAPSNAYLPEADLSRPEKYYPLKIRVCDHCWLVQTEDYAQADELFSAEYAYFSSTSTSWLAHASAYADKMIRKLELKKRVTLSKSPPTMVTC